MLNSNIWKNEKWKILKLNTPLQFQENLRKTVDERDQTIKVQKQH